MQLMKEKLDLTYLSWSVYRNSSGTAGSFLKAYSELGGKKTYYKLSNFDKARGVIGHECVNELIVDRLLTILGIPHVCLVPSYRTSEASSLLSLFSSALRENLNLRLQITQKSFLWESRNLLISTFD